MAAVVLEMATKNCARFDDLMSYLHSFAFFHWPFHNLESKWYLCIYRAYHGLSYIHMFAKSDGKNELKKRKGETVKLQLHPKPPGGVCVTSAKSDGPMSTPS